MRSYELSPTHGPDKWLIPVNTFAKWWSAQEKKSEREEFLILMGTSLADNSEEAANVSTLVKNALDRYVNFVGRKNGSYWRRFVHAITTYFLRPWFGITSYHNEKPLMEAAKLLADSGVKVDLKELMEIEAVIRDFHGITKH